jgi:hypothetical protein
MRALSSRFVLFKSEIQESVPEVDVRAEMLILLSDVSDHP